MIEFKEEWAEGMDGQKAVPVKVREYANAIKSKHAFVLDGTVGDAVDLALASLMVKADDALEAFDDLSYVISQLQKVQAKLFRAARETKR